MTITVGEAIAAVPSLRATDPCQHTGRGWIADEALATSLYCFLSTVDDPIDSLRRSAALHRNAAISGGSDTIASLTGTFLGAHHGLSAWPTDWIRRLEYRDRLAALGTWWESGDAKSPRTEPRRGSEICC